MPISSSTPLRSFTLLLGLATYERRDIEVVEKLLRMFENKAYVSVRAIYYQVGFYAAGLEATVMR